MEHRNQAQGVRVFPAMSGAVSASVVRSARPRAIKRTASFVSRMDMADKNIIAVHTVEMLMLDG